MELMFNCSVLCCALSANYTPVLCYSHWFRAHLSHEMNEDWRWTAGQLMRLLQFYHWLVFFTSLFQMRFNDANHSAIYHMTLLLKNFSSINCIQIEADWNECNRPPLLMGAISAGRPVFMGQRHKHREMYRDHQPIQCGWPICTRAFGSLVWLTIVS